MANIEYDLDVSGGLMPQIQALIAPPSSDDITKKGKKYKKRVQQSQTPSSQSSNHQQTTSETHKLNSPFMRQPKAGKVPNHEYCDSCREGGDLLCCDRCPAAFHLQCNEPPYDEEDVPQGEWICRRCKMTEQMEKLENGELNMEENGVREKGVEEKENGNLMEINNDAVNEDVESVGQLSEHQSQDDNQNQDDCEAKEEVEKDVEMNIDINDDESDQLINPLSLLIKAAKIMNPKQFQLPNELTPTIQLVGTSKKIIPWNRSSKKPPLHELDNGLVPLPVKTCFQCGMSCRKAPLIQCDYCVLLFHPDCLDPPLTCLPTGRWMCPNHAQHAIESKLLDSVSLTERIKLLDQFAGNLSQDVVKIDFLKKIHRKNPPFRCKLLGPPPERVLVPRAIKDMYKNPSPLLPKASSAHSFQQQNVLFKTEIKTEFKSELDKPSLEEQEEWLSSVIAFQGQVAKHLSLQRLQKEMKQNKSNSENSEPFSSSPSSTSSIITNRTSNDISSSFKLPNEKVMSKLMNGPVTVNHVTNNNRHLEPLEFNKNGIDNGVDMNIKIKSEMNGSKSPTSSSSSPVQAQHDKKINYSSPTCATINLNSMPVHIDDINDIELSKLDDKIMKVLAWQRLQQLIHAKSSQPENNSQNLVSPSSSSNSNSNSTTPQTPQTTVKRICLGDVKARAVLCPVFIRSSNGALNTNSSGPAIAMSYRTLTIGTGADNDVILGNYGQCMYVSGHHACIFYDETSKQYELINYSEHGTTVDNVLYSCDFSDKKIHNPKYASIDSHTVVAIKEVIKRGRKSKLELKRKAKELKFKEDNCEDDGEADDEMPVDGRVKKAKKMTKESVAGNVVAKASNNGQAAVKQLPSKPSRSSIKEGKDESNVNANVERISVQVQGLGHNNHVAPTMSSRVGSNCKSCACKASFSTLIGGSGAGWEGTAVLRHGSYIKIGCNQFVFSITNYYGNPNPLSLSSILLNSTQKQTSQCHVESSTKSST